MITDKEIVENIEERKKHLEKIEQEIFSEINEKINDGKAKEKEDMVIIQYGLNRLFHKKFFVEEEIRLLNIILENRGTYP